jgi:hypothetical protein
MHNVLLQILKKIVTEAGIASIFTEMIDPTQGTDLDQTVKKYSCLLSV